MSTDQRRLGPFQLEERLGAGGMGIVFRGVHIETRRQVAIKVLSEKAAASKKIVARFARELEILKALKHPNIVRCYGSGREGREAYLVMELVEGGSLSSLLKRRGRLSWEAVVEYALQICDGLAYAHSWGIVHRDLTPGNLLIGDDGAIKIADFGIARVQFGKRLTATKHTLGTMAYMAPEQIRGTPPVSHKTDLYTLGCVLFEMLTGRLPFQADSTAPMLYAHLETPPPRVSSIVLDCPVWLDALVSQMLEKDPANRPYDAGTVAQALREVRQKVTSGATVAGQLLKTGPSAIKLTTPDQAGARKLVGRKKRKKKKYALALEILPLVAGLLIVAGLACWAFWPLNEAQLFAKAEQLMASELRTDRQRARTKYLDVLLEKYPEGAHAARAREMIDQVEMDDAEARVMARIRQGRKAESEAEQLFMDAWRFDQFGDRLTALEKYRGLIQLVPDTGEDRPLVHLARRQVESLTRGGTHSDDSAHFIESRLTRADELVEQGQTVEAHEIWTSIVNLYRDSKQLRPLVEKAQRRLADRDEDDGDKASGDKKAPPPPESNAGAPTASDERTGSTGPIVPEAGEAPRQAPPRPRASGRPTRKPRKAQRTKPAEEAPAEDAEPDHDEADEAKK
ncbi:MAG TPA: protein kinase [Pirellulales bacterium]|nr:protein kinase [Pirellulales bacterium]